MYRNSYQRGMFTVFFSVGSKPLNTWETHTQDGYITRFLDQDIKSMVLEIRGNNVSTTYMTCPKGNMVLGITMPFLVMIVKNLKKYFSFEVTILDETGTRRRFRVSNFQSTTQILPLCTVMPIGLSDGWNQIQFNLAEFTRRAYNKQFVEVQKLKINANIRLRRIYFAERLIPEDQLPPEYKLYFLLASKVGKGKKSSDIDEKNKENMKPSTSQQTVLGMTEHKKGSKVEILKACSKGSIHSAKKILSQEKNSSSRDIIEEIPDDGAGHNDERFFVLEKISSEVEDETVPEVPVVVEGKIVQQPPTATESDILQQISEEVQGKTAQGPLED
ncbi:cilia- and flagella-associated protein 20 [Aphomia sociella]